MLRHDATLRLRLIGRKLSRASTQISASFLAKIDADNESLIFSFRRAISLENFFSGRRDNNIIISRHIAFFQGPPASMRTPFSFDAAYFTIAYAAASLSTQPVAAAGLPVVSSALLAKRADDNITSGRFPARPSAKMTCFHSRCMPSTPAMPIILQRKH